MFPYREYGACALAGAAANTPATIIAESRWSSHLDMIISDWHSVEMGLREEQRGLTRSKILGAVLVLVAEGSLDELSVPAVARLSGVSLATIYRHYPTRDELLAAAALEPARQVFGDGTPVREGDDELAAYQRALWSAFAHNLPLLRHQVASAAGREMRHVRLAQSRELVARYLPRFGIDPASPAGERLTALILLLTGSLGLVELHDRQQLSVEESIETSLWAVRALIDSSVREQV